MPQVSSSPQVRFSESALGSDTLGLTLETGTDDPGNPVPWQALRLFPDYGDIRIEASRGIVEYFGTKGQLTKYDIVQFGNSQSGSTQYPVDKNSAHVEVLFAYDASGNEVRPGDLSFVFTPKRTLVQANRPFIGAIKVRYTSTYRILRYSPEAGTKFNAAGQIIYANYGVVLAFKDSQFTQLDIRPADLNDAGPDLQTLLYKVTSLVQVNEAGAWEKHPTFETGGHWSQDGAPTQGSAYFEYEREHELGFLSTLRRGYSYETKHTEQEMGPTGTFTPVITIRYTQPSTFATGKWSAVYNALNISQVTADIQSRFPTATVE